MQRFCNNQSNIKLESKLVIGLMSGTSMDGIDAALVRITPKNDNFVTNDEILDLNIVQLCAKLYSFPLPVQDDLKCLIESDKIFLKELCKMNFILGELFAEAAIDLVQSYGMNISAVDLVGSHGQTIYHLPSKDYENSYPIKSTLQIGEPSIIAQRTGVDTIADFRPRDIASNGGGAPLVCFADKVLLSDQNEIRLVQNIGGIGNVTVLPGKDPPFAFDTGPGNSLIDLVAKEYFDVDFDESGSLAYSGIINEDWIEKVLEEEPYFNIKPPKTTGKELFNKIFLDKFLKKYPINNSNDLIATVTALTAKSIAQSYERFVLNKYAPTCIILGGGGAYNPFLIEQLDRYLSKSISIKTHEDFGISNKFKEAIAFAILAYTSYYGVPNNVPSCTGAKEKVVLGKFIPGKPR